MMDSDYFSECCEIYDDRPIRQGDVFEWLERGTDPWTKFGVVVTADCDIAYKKHRDILSYVPLLEIRDYLALFYLPARLEKASVPLREQLVKTIRALQTDYAQSFPQAVSAEAALRWVRTSTAAGVADELEVPAGRDRDRLLSLAFDYLAAEAGLRNGSFDELLDAFVRIRLRQGGSREQLLAQFWSDVETLAVNLPGDAFFIGRVGTQHSKGYVAYLRLVREIRQTSIATRQTDLRDSSVSAIRIASLTSPYVYRLTQQLAAVFSAIGLPSEYEDARINLVRRIASGVV